MGLNLAVVSDIHVGSAARARDLDPQDCGKGVRDDDYVSRFVEYCRNNNIRADFLIVPGDITNRATPDEFQLASRRLVELASGLEVPEDRILFVPGNHDVDWSVLKSDPPDKSGFRFAQRYQPLSQPNCIFSTILQKSSYGTVTDKPYFCLWDLPEMLVVGHNSALHDKPDSTVHHGLIPQESLLKLDEVLSRHPIEETRARLMIVHHHPLQYSDPIPNEPDFSAMTNAEALLKLLAKHKFDLLIHGHKHKPNFNIHLIDSYFAIPILGAGSFSYQLDSRWNGLVNNQFHHVEIHDRDPSDARLRGCLHSYTYLCGHGWRQSRDHNGIDHCIYFGGLASEGQLLPLLRSTISAELRQRSYVRWNEVSELHKELLYVPRKLLIQCLKTLQSDLGYTLYDSDANNMLLLR